MTKERGLSDWAKLKLKTASPASSAFRRNHCEYFLHSRVCVVHVQLIYMSRYVIGSGRVYVLQYLCERTQIHECSRTHTHNNAQTVIFLFCIRAKVLSLCNQLYPKTEIRLLPVTYFSLSHLQKL